MENEQPIDGVIIGDDTEKDLALNTHDLTDAFAGTLGTMITFAHKFPRQMKSVQKNAMAELEAVPGLAQRAYYSIPYKSEGGGRSMVEGLTIKASSALTRWWGNCGSAGRIAREDNSNYYAFALAIDFENLIPKATEWRVPKFYKPRGGQGLIPWDDTMMRNQVMAGISKARRNVELLLIPEWLKTMYFERAKELVIHPPKGQNKIVDSVRTRIITGSEAIKKDFGVTQDEMDVYILETLEGLDEASILTSIVSLYTGLKDGTVTLETIFGRKGKKNVAFPEAKK
jgi:hypothetical protein